MSIRAYVEVSKKAFQSNLAYRANYIIGILNTIISIFVYIAIWKAIFRNQNNFNGITLNMVITNFVLGLAVSSSLFVNDLVIAKKVISGSITCDLLKPVNFYLYNLFHNLGNIAFKLIIQFMPAQVLSIIIFGILPPTSVIALLLFIITIVLGFLITFSIGYIVSLLSFWIYNDLNIWSISTIKSAIITVLSGTLMPIWFMPQGLIDFIKLTPFDTIYFAPISIYLGYISGPEIGYIILKQIIWIAIFTSIGQLTWRAGVKKLVLHGG